MDKYYSMNGIITIPIDSLHCESIDNTLDHDHTKNLKCFK